MTEIVPIERMTDAEIIRESERRARLAEKLRASERPREAAGEYLHAAELLEFMLRRRQARQR
jgi:hypothetical protein